MTLDVEVAGLTDLRPALVRLDQMLRGAVDALRSDLLDRARDPFRGLYISEGDVDALLAAGASDPGSVTAASGTHRLAQVASAFALSDLECRALLVCLAPDVDLRYERLYAYLQDDVTRRRPTTDLILRLLCSTVEERTAARHMLGGGGRLLGRGVLVVTPPEAAEQRPLLARPLRVDDRIVEYLLGSDTPDPRLQDFARLIQAADDDRAWSLGASLEEGLIRLLSGHQSAVVYLQGPPGSGKRAALQTACSRAGRTLLLIDVPALLGSEHAPNGLVLAAHEARLQDAVLGLDGFDRLLGEGSDVQAVRTALDRTVTDFDGPIAALGEARWEPATWWPGTTTVRVELSSLDIGGRTRLWRHHVDGSMAADEVAELAARFKLGAEGVRATMGAARGRAAWRGAADVVAADVRAAARAVAAPPLDGLARHVETRYEWNDIVLPIDGITQLRELCNRFRDRELVIEQWGYGRKHARQAGLTALFAGPPGTGKTMAAEILSGTLGLELYRIDLSSVVSKYIGETEKNLERIFRAADQGDAVLLFDEADAIFGKRSEVRDAHDRYANVEIAYLLQRLEAYQGLAILTTNLRGNIDEAFIRRLDYVLEFPMPEEVERLAIWRRAVPADAPLAADVDLNFLSRKFKLAGGHIRNITLTAAFLAAADTGEIGMKHLARATRREYQKLGKLVAEADFEHYYPLLKEV